MNAIKALNRFLAGHKSSRRANRRSTNVSRFRLEALEDRSLMKVQLSVDLSNAVRTIQNVNMIGANVSQYDPYVTSSQESSAIMAGNLRTLRLTSGAGGDDGHFTDSLGVNTYDSVQDPAALAKRAGDDAMITANYGGGSPQEAAAYLAYLMKDPSTPDVNLGIGRYYDASTHQWINKDWKTANYWANLRGGAPDPIAYVEVGNEVYGTQWYPDHHGTDPTLPGDKPFDPDTYVRFVKQFAALASQFAPNVKIGVDVATPSAGSYLSWDTKVLQDLASGTYYVPAFLADHDYMQDAYSGNENDQTLLRSTATLGLNNTASNNLANDVSWQSRILTYRSLIKQYFPNDASKVQLIASEFNSVAGDGDNISKQTTSLVNGIFLADAVGGLLEPGFNTDGSTVAGYDGGYVWNFRNNYYGTGSGNTRTQALYGWRNGGDYGLFGADQWNGGGNSQSNTNVAYPSYYGMQMAGSLVTANAKVLAAKTDNNGLSIYAVQAANGKVSILIINKNAPGTSGADMTANLQLLGGLVPTGTWTVSQYGVAQDNAQKNGQAVNETMPSIQFGSGTQPNFSYTFPAYSMTLLTGNVTAPAAINVTNLNDSGAGSLRAAIALANASPNPDTIVFAPGLANGALKLSTIDATDSYGASAFTISTPVTIVGSGQIISPNTGVQMRLFNVTSTGSLNLSLVTLTGGYAMSNWLSTGGAISNNGTLVLNNDTITGNQARSTDGWSFGGGIFNGGVLTVTNSTIDHNTAGPYATNSGHVNGVGGGIYNLDSATVLNSTILLNRIESNDPAPKLSGGGFANEAGSATLTNVTVANNSLNSPVRAVGLGAGIDNHAQAGTAYGFAKLMLDNSIVFGSTGGPDLVSRGDSTSTPSVIDSHTKNIVGSWSGVNGGQFPNRFSGHGFITIDPQLAPLAFNGGPTRTLKISATSSAKDQGNILYGNGYDQRGVRRSDGAADLGAYEYNG